MREQIVALAHRHPLVRPQKAGQVWSMDFVFDRAAEGQAIKCLTVVDDATHEAVAIVPERAMLIWAHARGVSLFLIQPGKPNQNAYIKSLNGRFRDECLNENWFVSLAHARVVIEAWRPALAR